MGKDYSLRPARRSGGKQNESRVAGVCPGQRVSSPVRASRTGCQGMLAPVWRSVIRGGKLSALDHQPCRAVRQCCFDSFLRPLGMDGNIDSSGEKGGKNRDDRFGGLRQYQSYAVLLLDAVFDEPYGQRRSLLEQLAERSDPILLRLWPEHRAWPRPCAEASRRAGRF